MNYRLTLLLILIVPFLGSSFAQNSSFSKNDFVTPVEIPLYLSGTFGELRSNHFHAGIDIKTQGVEGKIVRSIDDGWISRIKVSTGGYGKAIYITHPDGYISVYGHLQRYSDTIQSIVINEQYEKESFTVQLFFDKGELPVQKGEKIAYSGNTGGSHGPHLHFEIRDEKTQNPLNPLLFSSFKIKDFYRPKITKLIVYPTNNTATINGKNDTVVFDIAGWGEEHRINNNQTITVSGNVSFGIGTYDLMNEIPNKNGVFSTKFFHDTTLIFNLNMSRLSFSTTRYINSLIDYSYYKKAKIRVVRTQVDTNNMLSNYVTVDNNGIININDTLVHPMTFEIRDAYDNLAKLSFNVTGEFQNSIIPLDTLPIKNNRHFNFSEKQSITTNNLDVRFPANCFYQSFNFDFQELNHDTTAYSATYKLHNASTPVQKYFKLKILPDSCHIDLIDKIYIAYSEDNDDYSYMGKSMKGKMIDIKSRSLGYYKILMDTTKPVIKEVNFKDNKNISKQKNLKIKISDKQTGIKSYKATLNGEWILMEYDTKKELLTYNYNELLLVGKNQFKLEVTDITGNQAEYKCIIKY